MYTTEELFVAGYIVTYFSQFFLCAANILRLGGIIEKKEIVYSDLDFAETGMLFSTILYCKRVSDVLFVISMLTLMVYLLKTKDRRKYLSLILIVTCCIFIILFFAILPHENALFFYAGF